MQLQLGVKKSRRRIVLHIVRVGLCWLVLAMLVSELMNAQEYSDRFLDSFSPTTENFDNSTKISSSNDTSTTASDADAIVPSASEDDKATFCSTTGSLNQIAFQMANISSPPGSMSYNKTLHVLQSAPRFHINLQSGIFAGVAQNIAAMLMGYGLAPHSRRKISPTTDDPVILIENSFYGARGKPNGCRGEACQAMPRIVIQSEQLSMGPAQQKYGTYLKKCHQSPICVIWDFANLPWATRNNIADSYMLLPIMHQTRFSEPYNRSLLQPALARRPLDVVFFALMTSRRKLLKEQFANQNWTMRFETSNDAAHVKESYADAKICLIVHSWNAMSAGEFHRLYEMAPSGCMPVVETFADEYASDIYTRCGGVTFASYDDLLPSIEKALIEINKTTTQSNEEAAKWWEKGINWKDILVTKFGKPKV